MTEVSFHSNVPDKLEYACRLLRKVYGTGARVVVTGSQEILERLDADLWTFSTVDFIPHCRLPGAAEAVLAATPVVLAEAPSEAPHREVLVNLGPAIPDGFERFGRLVEVVGQDREDVLIGRSRWKHYADRGYAMTHHELGDKAAR